MAGTTAPIPPAAFPFKCVTGDGIVKTGPGTLVGFLCTSSVGLTVKIYDNTSAAGTVIMDTMPVAAKESYNLPTEFNVGLFVDFIAGTGAITVWFI